MSSDAMKRQGFLDGYIYEYMNKQEKALCNLASNQSLQAVLQNETLPSNLAQWFICNMATNSKTDNGQAVSILLQDERCRVGIAFLDENLSRNFTAMAAVAQQEYRVKKDIEMCRTCSSNFGVIIVPTVLNVTFTTI
jgi:ribosomal protein S8